VRRVRQRPADDRAARRRGDRRPTRTGLRGRPDADPRRRDRHRAPDGRTDPRVGHRRASGGQAAGQRACAGCRRAAGPCGGTGGGQRREIGRDWCVRRSRLRARCVRVLSLRARRVLALSLRARRAWAGGGGDRGCRIGQVGDGPPDRRQPGAGSCDRPTAADRELRCGRPARAPEAGEWLDRGARAGGGLRSGGGAWSGGGARSTTPDHAGCGAPSAGRRRDRVGLPALERRVELSLMLPSESAGSGQRHPAHDRAACAARRTGTMRRAADRRAGGHDRSQRPNLAWLVAGEPTFHRGGGPARRGLQQAGMRAGAPNGRRGKGVLDRPGPRAGWPGCLRGVRPSCPCGCRLGSPCGVCPCGVRLGSLRGVRRCGVRLGCDRPVALAHQHTGPTVPHGRRPVRSCCRTALRSSHPRRTTRRHRPTGAGSWPQFDAPVQRRGQPGRCGDDRRRVLVDGAEQGSDRPRRLRRDPPVGRAPDRAGCLAAGLGFT